MRPVNVALVRLGEFAWVRTMQIAARIRRLADHWIVQLPKQHHLVKQLLKNWSELESDLEPGQKLEPTMALADAL